MKHICSAFLLVMLDIHVFAQGIPRKYTISGYMKDSLSTEKLIGTTVYNKANFAGTATNQYGFYSLTLPEGRVELTFSYVGYRTRVRNFYLRGDTTIQINLEGSVHLREIEITADKTSRIQEHTQMSSINVPMAQIKSLPAFLGEVDIMKVLQLMPGIQSGGEGSSGLYVRGGGPDQNLILLDGVPVYNVSHLFGFFSVFNADAINSMEIFKGGFPARYGGRVSSVLDISMKEGNMQKFHGEGAVGLVSTKLTLEGPIWKDRTSFIVSGRRTYIDALVAPFMGLVAEQNQKLKVGYYFYDLTAKINHRFSANDRIYLSAYIGDDKFRLKSEREYDNHSDWEKNQIDDGLKWGNVMAAFRWNHIFTNRLFGNTTLTYSKYSFYAGSEYELIQMSKNDRTVPPTTETKQKYYDVRYDSKIQDWSGKIAFDYLPSPNHYIRFGANAIYHTFSPGVMAIRDTIKTENLSTSKLYAWEYSAYAEDDIKLTNCLKANVGLHWSAFDVVGKFYNVWQPRISVRYLITPQLSVKASYSRMAQYVHLLTNSNVGLPTDLWVPSTAMLQPQESDQIAVGLAQNFRENYEISLEGYYKTMHHVMEYKEGANFLIPDESWEEKIRQGSGRSYGVELFAQKKTGSFTGWVGYTLAWTDRQFDELNGGKRFYYKYDRRHDVSIALMKRFGEKIELSGTWVYGTGSCVTIPIGIYRAANPIWAGNDKDTYQSNYYEFGERNGYRMAPYHRLDLSIAFIKKKKWGERRWVVGLYNVYNRKNPYFMDVKEKNDKWSKTTQFKYIQYSLFPIIPSVSYHFKF